MNPNQVAQAHIRRAQVTDAGALARLAEATFRDTFAYANTSQDMDDYCKANYSAELQAAQIADPGLITLVCGLPDLLTAFAQLKPGSQHPQVAGRAAGEIQRLYLDCSQHGTGLAQTLMAACQTALQAAGCEVIWLGVWEHNARAIAFYEKCGFNAVGETTFMLGQDRQRDIVMARSALVFTPPFG